MPDSYELSRVAFDAVVFTIEENRLKVLLHTREKEPFKDLLELPGGLLKQGEAAEQTLARKMSAFVRTDEVFFLQFHTFTKPTRDPRTRTVSIAYIALVSSDNVTDRTLLVDVATVKRLAFDHKEILDAARVYLKAHIDPLLMRHFMPQRFPLNALQDVYELIAQQHYDNRNFRKMLLASGLLVELSQIEQNVSHRPAKLFRFK